MFALLKQRYYHIFKQPILNLLILELLPRLPSIKKHLAINQVISIPPEELILPTVDGGTVSIPIPNSHIGKKPIHVRLLSSKRRLGMVNSILT